jgi:cell division protein FtsW
VPASRASVRERPHLRVVRPGERPPRPRATRSPHQASSRAGRDRSVSLLLGSTALLVGLGLIMVLSASSVSAYARYGSSFLYFRRQLVYALIGSAVMLVTARMRVKAWERLAAPLAALSIVLLAVVLHPAAGTVAGGSARWLALGPVTVQPSELAKFSVVALSATVLARKWRLLSDPVQVALPLLPIVGVVCALVLIQPDLGTMTIIAATLFLMLFAAGVRLRYLAMSGSLAIGVGLTLIMSEHYRRARFLSFLHPQVDPRASGYQIIQSLIALTSGSWFGVGLGASRQKWSYVPNAHTDFIFSIVREELGLAGSLALLALFGLFVYAGVRIALRAPDIHSRLLAAGIVGWLSFQTLVNLGAVTGLLPITGVPLPFVSFGGSSLVVSMAGVGVLVAIARQSARSRSRT